MSRVHEELSARFRQWELRTRGSQVYPHPVPPEPPFVPFPGHYVGGAAQADDGRKPTIVSSLFHWLWDRPKGPEPAEEEEEPETRKLERAGLVELPLYLPVDFEVKGHLFDAFTRALFVC